MEKLAINVIWNLSNADLRGVSIGPAASVAMTLDPFDEYDYYNSGYSERAGKEELRPSLPRRGLYLGRRVPDVSRYGRYLTERPEGCRSTFLPPVVGTGLMQLSARKSESR